MGKASRLKRVNGAEVRIQLTSREFTDFQGVCAVAALKVHAIQQQAAQQIAAAQQDRQKAFLRLVKKYRSQGMQPDGEYTFDEATHTLRAMKTGTP